MSWIPLLKLDDSGTVFGLADGQWGAQTNSGEIVSVASHPHAFLPFLEIGLVQAEKMIEESLAKGGLLRESLPRSPLIDAIKCGLHASTEYWQVLALRRVTGSSEKSLFLNDVRALATTGATQAVRHEARKIEHRILSSQI